MSNNAFPDWTPAELSDWLNEIEGKFPQERVAYYRRLASDERMREVWEWFDTIKADLGRWRDGSPVDFVLRCERAMQIPLKPGDMAQKQRDQYLQKVRRHAEALLELLEGTRYDCSGDEGTELDIDDPKIEKRIGDNVTGTARFAELRGYDFFLSYFARGDGRLFELPWDYPESCLTNQLHGVVAWTHKDDFWGRNLASSKPFQQSFRKLRPQHFNCTLYEDVGRYGVKIPFRVLAAITNVALELPPEQQVDEETARKHVARYLERRDDPNGTGSPAVPPLLDF